MTGFGGRRALAGVLVADFSRVLANPLATMTLGQRLAGKLARRADVLVENLLARGPAPQGGAVPTRGSV